MSPLRHAFGIVALFVAAAVQAGTPETGPSERRLVIRPASDARWEADLADVTKVLCSSAEALWVHFPGRVLPPILVEPKGGPVTLYERGPNGELRVRLNTGGTYWCQYAYQFAHEFCHILCNYTEGDESNKWFEESVCEMGSLFALRRMAETWKSRPPYPNWRDFAPHLGKYADAQLAKDRLPQGMSLAQWYARHESALRKEPCLRDKNRVVASVLLPLFEQRPEHWEAVTWLNAETSAKPRSFTQYLADWHRHCPAKHKPFVRDVAGRFGLTLPAD